MAVGEAAAAHEPAGPARPQGPAVGVDWLILQRLEDLRRAQDEMRGETRAVAAAVTDLQARMDTRFGALEDRITAVRTDLEGRIESVRTDLDGRIESVRTGLEGRIESVRTDLEGRIESVRSWSIGLLLIAVLGLLAKLLLPGA